MQVYKVQSAKLFQRARLQRSRQVFFAEAPIQSHRYASQSFLPHNGSIIVSQGVGWGGRCKLHFKLVGIFHFGVKGGSKGSVNPLKSEPTISVYIQNITNLPKNLNVIQVSKFGNNFSTIKETTQSNQ